MQTTTQPDRLEAPFAARLRSRDPAALADLHRRIRGEVQRVIRTRVADPETAADLEQEVYLFVFRSLDRFDPERPLRPWVRTIAQNRLRDHWRSLGSRPRHEELGEVVDTRPRSDSGTTTLERRESIESMRRALDQLPASMRPVFDLRLRERLSFQEIGAALNKSSDAVRKRFSRGLALLRADASISADALEVA